MVMLIANKLSFSFDIVKCYNMNSFQNMNVTLFILLTLPQSSPFVLQTTPCRPATYLYEFQELKMLNKPLNDFSVRYD